MRKENVNGCQWDVFFDTKLKLSNYLKMSWDVLFDNYKTGEFD